MLDNFKNVARNEIESTISHIDDKMLFAARDLILESEKNKGRVHVTGIGKPSYVAGYIASLLSSTGTAAYFLDGTEAVHGSSGQVRPGDVVIAISNSGETKELLYTIETLKTNKAKVISVSRDLESQLSKQADIALCARAENEGDDLGKPPRTSILSEMITLQCLSVLLQEARELDMTTYVKWHPGGAIGMSIKEA